MFNQEIDRITQTFNKALQNYKNKFSGIFNSIIEPFNKKSFLKFRKGEFNEEIIRELYTSSKQVETYSSLIG